MLGGLSDLYRKEAATYFGLLLAEDSSWRGEPLTLLHMAFTDQDVRDHFQANDRRYFDSEDSVRVCD